MGLRILGIDPGIAIVGFGLIEADGAQAQMLRYGAITTEAGLPLADLSMRLFREKSKAHLRLRRSCASGRSGV